MRLMLRVNVCITLLAASITCGACSRSDGVDGRGVDGSTRTSSSSSSQRIGSCDRVVATGTCSEYAGTYLVQNEILLTSSCGKLGGTFVYAECPNTSVVGACTLSTSEIRKFYGTGAAAYEPDRAKTECVGAFSGAWQAR